jgi:hypothetical protein
VHRWSEGKLETGLLETEDNLHFIFLGRLFRRNETWSLGRILGPDAAALGDPHFYDHAWSLVTYLARHPEASVRRGFRAYEKSLFESGKPKPPGGLCRHLGMGVEELERNWRAFWREKTRKKR